MTRSTIGFCMTAMNRAWQLRETLPDTLGVLADTGHFLALCDYNSTDDIHELVGPLERHMREGRFFYFRTTEPTSFHASRAKNAAHRLALRFAANVLFNLDADNFISREIIAETEDVFMRDADACLHNWSGAWGDGSFGRIAMSAGHWVRLGGYDETFLPMSWQDTDLLLRARAACLHYVQLESLTKPAITNTMHEKLRHTSLTVDVDSPERSFLDANVRNALLSLSRPIFQSVDDHVSLDGTINFRLSATI
jgi:hypothetical protein